MLLIAALSVAEVAVIVTAYLLGAARGKAPDWASQKSLAAVRAEEDALVRQVATLVDPGLLTVASERAAAGDPATSASAGGEGR